MNLAQIIKGRIKKIKLPSWESGEFVELTYPSEGVLLVALKMKDNKLEKPIMTWDCELETSWEAC